MFGGNSVELHIIFHLGMFFGFAFPAFVFVDPVAFGDCACFCSFFFSFVIFVAFAAAVAFTSGQKHQNNN